VLSTPDEVIVIVDQSRDHRAAPEIDHLRLVAGQLLDGCRVAHRDEATALDGKAARDRKLIVHREHFPVHVDDIGASENSCWHR
jgi:hypothetical protein